MIIRIFTASPDHGHGFDKYLNFLRLEMDNKSKPWVIGTCDPIKWLPTTQGQGQVADIHIYIDNPIRLAIPWTKFNVLISNTNILASTNEIDMILPTDDLCESAPRSTILNNFRRILRMSKNESHPPTLPIPSTDNAVKYPKVGVITVTRNRKAWWLNMVQNILKQEWPASRLEWILVDDGDEGQRLEKEVAEFCERSPGMIVRYVEVAPGTTKTIGEKCNIAVNTAPDDVTVFVRMDDDDHYPPNSIQTRVSWLHRNLISGSGDVDKNKSKTDKKAQAKAKTQAQAKTNQSQIVYCSTIPMYDVRRYISAMNVPDVTLCPCDRVSEATLAFTRDAWLAKPFSDVSMAEGMSFLDGREDLSVEIPPTGVIVSFIHSKNSSSRRVPAEQEPNGCHYGFSNEFFGYLTGL